MDFNSSDVEFEAAPSKNTGRPGLASIARIVQDAESDRLTSKRTVKQLQFGRGSPGSRYDQELWVGRFNVFRQVTLHQSLDEPFTGTDVIPSLYKVLTDRVGEDLIRFFDTIIDKIKPGYKGKPAPSDQVVNKGVKILLDFGTFTYAGFHITKQHGVRLQTFKDDAVKEGRLTKGKWKKRVWLTFMVMARIGKAWLEFYHKNGAICWDIPLARWMSILLVSSLGSRGGEAARSRLYTGMEYLQYRHVELVLDGEGEGKFENLRAHFLLQWCKGAKDESNKDWDVYMRPLQDTKFQHMCPLALLLAHALRHGLVHGTTIQEVLQHTAQSPDKKIQWLYPMRPVVALFNRTPTLHIELDHPAGIDQLYQSIMRMGIISNVLTRVYTHALRIGAAKDVAHLPKDKDKDGAGFSTNSVRQSLNHTNASRQRGVTDAYAGHPTREFYNARVDREYENLWGPKFADKTTASANDFVNGPVTKAEIQEWQKVNEPDLEDPDSYTAKARARRNVRRIRHETFVATTQPVSGTPAGVFTEKSVLTNKTPSEMNVLANFVRSHSDRPGKEETTRTNTRKTMREPAQTTDERSIDLSTIDPRLLDEGTLDGMTVDDQDMSRLRLQLLPEGNDELEMQDDTEALFVEDYDDCESQQAVSATDFITAYSRINIVSCDSFRKAWLCDRRGQTSTIGLHSVAGNSRDPPTPLEYHCRQTSGCPYMTVRPDNIIEHEMICNEVYVARAIAAEETSKDIPCTRGCELRFANKDQLWNHIYQVHNFEPTTCPRGCNPEKVYTTEAGLRGHLELHHSGRWPTACRYPGCTVDKTFSEVGRYSLHLREHGLATKQQRLPYLPEPAKPSPDKIRKVWEPLTCPLNCASKSIWKAPAYLKRHLMQKHKYGEEKATETAEGYYVFKSVAEIAGTKRKAGAEDTDEDTDEAVEEDL